jgi:cyclopropane fatty-acyl-phospholipid synthase-like methyltransferase
MCAAPGLHATGADLSTMALGVATGKAEHRGLTAQFHFDVHHVSELEESFDTALDRGILFHVYENDNDRGAYLHALRMVLSPGRRYFALCFRGPSLALGHSRLTPEQITAGFTNGRRSTPSIPPTSPALSPLAASRPGSSP